MSVVLPGDEDLHDAQGKHVRVTAANRQRMEEHEADHGFALDVLPRPVGGHYEPARVHPSDCARCDSGREHNYLPMERA